MAFFSPNVEGVAWIIGGLAAACVLVALIRLLEAAAHRARANVIATLLSRLSIPAAIALVVGGVYAGMPLFGVERQWAYNLLISLLIAVGGYAVAAAITTVTGAWLSLFVQKTQTRADDNFLPLFQGFFKLAIIAAAFAWILTTWGVHIGPLVAGLGIAGLAVGLALQKTMANIIGGIALILDDTYNVGDVVHLDTGEVGEVTHIGLRSTKILNEDGQLMVLPNDVMANAKIINYALPNETLRLVIPVGIAYGADVEKAREVMLRAVKSVPYVVSSPQPVAHLTNLGDFALQFKIKFYVEHFRKRHDALNIANQKVYEALRKAKIDVPFPTQTIHVKKRS
jgi:MscS family membrane protein